MEGQISTFHYQNVKEPLYFGYEIKKGRDFYDAIFLLSKTKPNMDFFRNLVEKTSLCLRCNWGLSPFCISL
ncbi:MAG: hypothetical protein J6U22_03570 [Bacteroidaceae bacterium]|nr:hypothetical protein [Bacteroidaceae bacterium]